MVNTLQPRKGVSAPAVTSIPQEWNAEWFRRWISTHLQNSDIRNAQAGVGITITGNISQTGTVGSTSYTASGLYIFTGGVEIGSPAGGSKGPNTINSPIANTYLDGVAFQAISPVWTGNHTYTPTSGTALTINGVAAGTPEIRLNNQVITGVQLATFSASNKPGSNNQSTPAVWLPLNCDGTIYYFPGFAA